MSPAQQYQQFNLAPQFFAGVPAAAADFNGDGKDDLAVFTSTGQIGVALSTGNSFAMTDLQYPAAAAPLATVVGDFNGDGKLDIAITSWGVTAGVAGASTSVLSILLGNGDGTFQPHVDTVIPVTPYAIAVGDLNHDGKLDVIVGASAPNTTPQVSILLGNGNGTFQAHVDYTIGSLQTVGASPISIAVADLNRDNNLDVIADIADGTVVLFGNSDGSLQPPITYPNPSGLSLRKTAARATPKSISPLTWGGLQMLAVGDFNGDGKPDFADVTIDGAEVRLNAGDGTLQANTDYPCVSHVSGNAMITARDINGDGNLDLVVENQDDQSVSLMFGKGDGTFQPCINYATGANSAVVVGDFNGDGRLDLATDTSLLLNNGDGTFPVNRKFFTGGSAAVVIADFNGDGIPDLATANSPLCLCVYSDTVSVLLGNGDGTYRPHLDSNAGSVQHLAAGDFNGDGRLDLVAASIFDKDINVLLGNGDGTFKAPVSYPTPSNAWSSAIADFNKDGKLDIAVANSSTAAVSIFLGNGDGTFRPRIDLPTAYGTLFIGVGDFDGDGNPDIAAAGVADILGQTPGQVSVLLGNGDGTFQTHRDYAVGQAIGLAIADFNNDGKQDLVVANGFPRCTLDQYGDPHFCVDDSNVSVLLGNGDGTFKSAVNYDTQNGPFVVAVGDLNGDGILDIVTGNPQIDIFGDVPGTTISVLWGNGNGTFRPHVDYQASGPPMFVAIGDLNGDRKNDVAVAVANSSTVTPLLNISSGPADVLSVSTQTPSPLPPSVLLMPGATNCPACGVAFVPGTAVTLTPEPAGDGTILSGWSGSCSGSGTCILSMTGDKSVTADFAPDPSSFALTININGPGSGSPVTEQPYISCTSFYCAPSLICNDNACSANYPTGNVVVIGAVPDPVSTFAGWSGGGCYANQIDCTVTMNSAVTVTANFNRIPGLQKLTVVFLGSGHTLITSDPAGINCPGASGACSAAFATGTTVSLTPSRIGIGETFNWSGSGCSGSGTCTVILSSDLTVTATTTDSPDFGIDIYPQLSPNPITAGQSASAGVQLLQGDQTFSGTINLICSIQPAPQYAPTCALNPPSSTILGSVTLTVSTTATKSVALLHYSGPLQGGLYAIGLCALGLVFTGFCTRRPSLLSRRLHSVYAACVVLLLVGLTISCGGGNSTSNGGSTRTPPGTYTITVTGTSGSLQHSSSMSLTVQ
jgi:hypothetical protein